MNLIIRFHQKVMVLTVNFTFVFSPSLLASQTARTHPDSPPAFALQTEMLSCHVVFFWGFGRTESSFNRLSGYTIETNTAKEPPCLHSKALVWDRVRVTTLRLIETWSLVCSLSLMSTVRLNACDPHTHLSQTNRPWEAFRMMCLYSVCADVQFCFTVMTFNGRVCELLGTQDMQYWAKSSTVTSDRKCLNCVQESFEMSWCKSVLSPP